ASSSFRRSTAFALPCVFPSAVVSRLPPQGGVSKVPRLQALSDPGMLLQIRNLTRGAVATIILGLVGIAMVAFLVPGGGLQFNLSQNVAEVAGRAISPAQLTRELEVTLRAQRNEGQNMTQQEAIDAGLHLQLLESMIGRYALYAYAEKLGV